MLVGFKSHVHVNTQGNTHSQVCNFQGNHCCDVKVEMFRNIFSLGSSKWYMFRRLQTSLNHIVHGKGTIQSKFEPYY